MISTKAGKIVGLAALVSNLALTTPLTQGETGAVNAFRRYWNDNQFLRSSTWYGHEDSTNTVQGVDYISFIDIYMYKKKNENLTDVGLVMAINGPVTALQRRAILDEDGAYVEVRSFADSLLAEQHVVNNLLIPHVSVQQSGIEDPYENPIRETTWGNVKDHYRTK